MEYDGEKACIWLRKRDVDILSNISNEFRIEPDYIVSMLIRAVFSKKLDNTDAGTLWKQRAPRKQSNLQCLVKFSTPENEIYYMTSVVTNISLFGICLSIDDAYGNKERIAKISRTFEVNTYAQHENMPISFICKTSHVGRHAGLRVGGALISPDPETFRFFFRTMLWLEAPPPPVQ